MQNEKWKGKTLLLVICAKKLRLRLFASHIKFIFLDAIVRFLPESEAFSLLSVKIDGKFGATFWVIPRWWSTTSHAKFTCASLISSLFILLLRSLKAAISMANRFVEILLLLFFNIFPFFRSQISRSSPLKWQKIMHPSGLHFNGTFQFSLRRCRRRRFASNHHPKPIAWAAEKGTRLVERHKSGKSYCFRLISEVSISLCRWWLLVCLFWRGFARTNQGDGVAGGMSVCRCERMYSKFY